jgi:hypothetical protein
MLRWRNRLILAAVGCLILATTCWSQQEDGWKEVTPNDLPAAVVRSLRTEFPKEDIGRAFAGVGQDDGRFRVVMNFGSGERVGVEMDADGTILASRDLSNEVSPKDLPDKVTAALKSNYPGAEIYYARKAQFNKQDVFEVSMRHDKKRRTVTFDMEGAVLLVRTEVAPTDLPKEVAATLKERYPGIPVRRAVEIAEKGQPSGYEVVVRPMPEAAALRLRFAPDGRLLDTANVRSPGNQDEE